MFVGTSGVVTMSLSGFRARGAFLIIVAATMLVSTPASAENPFVAFFRGDWLRPRPAAPSMSYAPAPDRGLSITVTPRRSRSGAEVVYCVRTCDGSYFPLSGVNGSSSADAVERCNNFCPASPTKVFISYDRKAGIEAARAKDGMAYSSLDNAYAYRTSISSSCTCNTGGPAGVAAIDIMDDPTLKAGDLVVTENGVMVFRGGKSLPHSESDFSAAANDRKLPASTRRELESLEIASGNAPVPAETPGL